VLNRPRGQVPGWSRHPADGRSGDPWHHAAPRAGL